MERDGHIRILPIHVANKIAAGEVVERPASALKELIENAIDAGADRIDIAVTSGGRKLVSVRDNGCGMNREDALLSLERQATSKIRDVDDIERIDTLGFRGEAIPSIAAVSRFTLVTRRREDESGTRLTVNAGTIAEVAECGTPPGTCVEVRDLFCNVPARKKFLRSYATEEGHIKSVFTVSALAHPELGFSLTVDGRELHRFAPGSTLEERIASLFGRDFADELIAVKDKEHETSDGLVDPAVRVYGYIARPSPNPLRREQFIFVNGRPATAPIITYALKEAYPSGHAESRPSIFLFIDVPPTEVDVNVHPAKREVRFRHPADIKAAIVAALTAALNPQLPPSNLLVRQSFSGGGTLGEGGSNLSTHPFPHWPLAYVYGVGDDRIWLSSVRNRCGTRDAQPTGGTGAHRLREADGGIRPLIRLQCGGDSFPAAAHPGDGTFLAAGIGATQELRYHSPSAGIRNRRIWKRHLEDRCRTGASRRKKRLRRNRLGGL